jgi:SAM-dependent methyltransferase
VRVDGEQLLLVGDGYAELLWEVNMKYDLVYYVVCPECFGRLQCLAVVEADGEIETGTLVCQRCGENYPIVRFVPRFVTSTRYPLGKDADTADAFGWEWQEFTRLHDTPTYAEQFLDWLEPIDSSFFQGKVVLDAGCGMGRFARVSSLFGAKEVLAVDVSDAVESAYHNTRDLPNVHVIQADIYHLPLPRGKDSRIDFVFSIGVLHHLSEPQRGFDALVRCLGQSGKIFVWVYGRENNGWLVRVVDPVRTALTSRLPRRALYVLSWLIAVGLHPVVKVLYRPLSMGDICGWLYQRLPYGAYFSWLGQFRFRHTHHVVFDHLVAPVAFYLSREEIEAWFQLAGVELIDVSWRNRNSWRAYGRLAS